MKSETVRRIAEEVASGINADVEILAAIPTRGGSSYFELLLFANHQSESESEPRRVLVGANRSSSEAEFRSVIRDQLQHVSHPERAGDDG